MNSTDKIVNHHNSKLIVNGAGNFIEVTPGTPNYKMFLRGAVNCKDIDTLSRIRGNTDKAVRIIDSNHYGEYLEAYGQRNDVIVVSRGLFRRWNKLTDGTAYDWQGIEKPFPTGQGGWVEIGTYESYEQIRERIFKGS